MKGSIAVLVFLLAIPSFAQVRSRQTTEPTYLESALKWPTYFGVSAGEYDDIWNRARTWAIDNGDGKLTVDHESEITAIRPPGGAVGARTIRVTSSETFGGYRITVEVVAHRSQDRADAERLAHLLAYHLASGRPIPAELASQ